MKRRRPTELYQQAGGIGGGGNPPPTVQTPGQQERDMQRLQLSASNTIFDKAMAFRSQERQGVKGLNDTGLKNAPQYDKGFTQALQMQQA
ncbi:MAG: hypothetical protein KC476_02420 [Cyanobacteria bacterium HKST-UBA06]|nr:hypothetical protein [Cyanobacteria bacterium HKST-UBA04]MCA9806784.1 hypothetical protein [Cyanobacteria bacterium HKST-UBA06]MCA9842076.1 hypothetical protein [Cyanobacteria bacterium HKST-UBA03]